jgi:hypothetical protein
MKQPEYIEGPEALENFERLATTILQASKVDGRKIGKKSSKEARKRKPKLSDKD